MTGRRGRRKDAFYRACRDPLRAAERLTDRQPARVHAALAADPTDQLWAAWIAKKRLRPLYDNVDRPAAERYLAGWLDALVRHREARTSSHSLSGFCSRAPIWTDWVRPAAV
jgi:hypothetical protein